MEDMRRLRRTLTSRLLSYAAVEQTGEQVTVAAGGGRLYALKNVQTGQGHGNRPDEQRNNVAVRWDSTRSSDLSTGDFSIAITCLHRNSVTRAVTTQTNARSYARAQTANDRAFASGMPPGTRRFMLGIDTRFLTEPGQVPTSYSKYHAKRDCR